MSLASFSDLLLSKGCFELIPADPRAIFNEDQGQWNTYCKIDAEVGQSTWAF